MSDLMQTRKRNSRNGLIELYRFLFALNVVKNHGFMPTEMSYFHPGRVSVEFFFILSGYLFFRTLDRLGDLPLKNSLPRMVVGKLKPIFIPLAIGLASNLVSDIISGDYFSGIWGYLWYVKSMMLVFIAYVIARRLIKNDKAFLYTVLGVFVVATLMRFSGVFYEWGDVRAASAISLGMLLSKLPPLKLKRSWPVVLVLIPVQIACLAVVALGLGNVDWFGGFRGVELILDIVLYPALIYLSFNIKLRSKLCNYLGALSFGLYAFQCPADLLRVFGIGNCAVWLLFIVGATLAEDTSKRICAWKKLRETQHTPSECKTDCERRCA